MMKILVCVKQVTDPDAHLEIDSKTGWIREHDAGRYRMNRFDEYALEEAMQIKESFSGVSVDAISVGPKRVEETLKNAIAHGADNGIHILHKANGYIPSYIIASLIAGFAKDKSYDLILTGVMSEDIMQSQVGPMTAAMLDVPCVTSVTKEKLDIGKYSIYVECEMQSGLAQTAVMAMPALITIQSGINQPRYPSLSNKFRSMKQELITIKQSTFNITLENDFDFCLSYPEKPGTGVMLEGTKDEKAEKLLKIFYEKSLLK
jgi:electron transfer flavoprotein beta subunit